MNEEIMMKDRELLEMAAKAYHAGNPAWKNSPAYQVGFMGNWNPLNDDGDALRLAVELHMLCDFGGSGIYVEAPSGRGPFSGFTDYRRAIVSAAAEIGKSMPRPPTATP